jgi:hypothetical protein
MRLADGEEPFDRERGFALERREAIHAPKLDGGHLAMDDANRTEPTAISTEKMRMYHLSLMQEDAGFVLAIASDDDFMAVVRTHTYIDALLDDLLRTEIVPGRSLPRNMSFTIRYELCVALGLLESDLIPTLQILSEIRNDFAHKPDFVIDRKKIDKLVTTIKGEFESFMEEFLEDLPEASPDREKRVLRVFLSAIHSWIQGNLEERREEQGPTSPQT